MSMGEKCSLLLHTPLAVNTGHLMIHLHCARVFCLWAEKMEASFIFSDAYGSNACGVQVLKRRMSDRKEDTERCVLLLRKLGEADQTLQDRQVPKLATCCACRWCCCPSAHPLLLLLGSHYK